MLVIIDITATIFGSAKVIPPLHRLTNLTIIVVSLSLLILIKIFALKTENMATAYVGTKAFNDTLSMVIPMPILCQQLDVLLHKDWWYLHHNILYM